MAVPSTTEIRTSVTTKTSRTYTHKGGAVALSAVELCVVKREEGDRETTEEGGEGGGGGGEDVNGTGDVWRGSIRVVCGRVVSEFTLGVLVVPIFLAQLTVSNT